MTHPTSLHQTRYARRVVLCLLLSWGVALASPLVNRTPLYVVYSSSGLALVPHSEHPNGEGLTDSLDLRCAACLPVGLVPVDISVVAPPQFPHAPPMWASLVRSPELRVTGARTSSTSP